MDMRKIVVEHKIFPYRNRGIKNNITITIINNSTCQSPDREQKYNSNRIFWRELDKGAFFKSYRVSESGIEKLQEIIQHFGLVTQGLLWHRNSQRGGLGNNQPSLSQFYFWFFLMAEVNRVWEVLPYRLQSPRAGSRVENYVE